MLDKKKAKLEYIDTNIKTSVSDVIKEVEQKFLSDAIGNLQDPPAIEDNSEENKK
jgi:hypothetical protein